MPHVRLRAALPVINRLTLLLKALTCEVDTAGAGGPLGTG
jgi:hypothetical protein